MSALPVFDDVHYDRLNPARGAVVTSLLSELGASLGLRTAIDVGCGLGYFSGVLDSLGLDVLAVDGRLQNVQEAGRRFPGIRFHQCDAQDAALRDLGKFDLVFCFGLLYHLENPLMTIRHLHAMTSKLLLIEAVIFPGDEPIMALVDEGLTEDQGLNHIAFYPTESCLVKMLYRAGFRNVYGFETQPDHSEYRAGTNSRRTRTMLAASLDPISSPALTRIAEVSTPIAPWDPKSGIPQLGRMPNLRRFLSSPKRVKYLLVGRRVRRFLDRWPEPLQLPYGMWWLAEHSALDYTLSAGAFESAETNFVQKFLRPGQMALDIGAHHGFYTLLISKLVGRSGRVISFEPSPRERKRLEAHIRLNSCSNVRVCGVALGEAASREKLYLVDGGEDWCNSLRPPAVHAKTRQIEVEVKTLDGFLAESAISAVDFMKIDVEGAEMDVLKGATKLLQSTTRPVLLVEVYDIRTEPWGYQACEIVQFLSGAGYCWFRLSHDGLPHPISVDQKKYDANLVAVPQERVQKFLESMA